MEVFSPEKLRKRREKLNLTQGQLSQLAKVSRIHLIDIEKGRKLPGASILARLADTLRVKIDYFFVKKDVKVETQK